MIRLYLVRHGETEFNLEGRIQGHNDSPLTELGVLQAKAIAKRLSGFSFDAIYSSDLGRTIQTANEIASYHDNEIISEPLLREMNHGVLQGLTREDIDIKYPRHKNPWRENRTMRVPKAEKWEEVIARCEKFLSKVISKHQDNSHILVVGHGGSLRGLIIAACGLPTSFWRVVYFANCGFSVLDIGDMPKIQCLNDTSHLLNIKISDEEVDMSAR
ncbi:MAG: histidine phosphatase family protein [Armatimonadota bacterium]